MILIGCGALAIGPAMAGCSRHNFHIIRRIPNRINRLRFDYCTCPLQQPILHFLFVVCVVLSLRNVIVDRLLLFGFRVQLVLDNLLRHRDVQVFATAARMGRNQFGGRDAAGRFGGGRRRSFDHRTADDRFG